MPEYVGEITKLDVSGWYWLPLWKSGSCKYEAKVRRDNEFVADASGTVELTVTGFCSAHQYRAEMRKLVGKRMHHYISTSVHM